jgi:Bacterial Ig-like domain
MVDGATIGTVSTSRWTAQRYTITVTDGTHSLTVTVTDSAGRMATSTAVPVTVSVPGPVAQLKHLGACPSNDAPTAAVRQRHFRVILSLT